MTRFRPNVTVACVIEASNRFLLVEERIDNFSRLNQPAGHIESGESLIDACKREVYEETGLVLSPQYLLSINQWQSPAGTQFLRFCFVTSIASCMPTQPKDSQIVACHWLTRKEIAQQNQRHRSPLVQQAIDDFDRKEFTPLSLLQSELASR